MCHHFVAKRKKLSLATETLIIFLTLAENMYNRSKEFISMHIFLSEQLVL